MVVVELVYRTSHHHPFHHHPPEEVNAPASGLRRKRYGSFFVPAPDRRTSWSLHAPFRTPRTSRALMRTRPATSSAVSPGSFIGSFASTFCRFTSGPLPSSAPTSL